MPCGSIARFHSSFLLPHEERYVVTPRYFDPFLMTVIAINFELNENLPLSGCATTHDPLILCIWTTFT